MLVTGKWYHIWCIQHADQHEQHAITMETTKTLTLKMTTYNDYLLMSPVALRFLFFFFWGIFIKIAT